MVFGFKLSPALVDARAGDDVVAAELVALAVVPDAVAVVNVLAVPVAPELELAAVPVLLEVKVLTVDEVWSKTAPEVVEDVPVAEAEAEEEAELDALELLPELALEP